LFAWIFLGPIPVDFKINFIRRNNEIRKRFPFIRCAKKPLAEFHWTIWVDLIHYMDQYLLFSLLVPQNAMNAGFLDTSFTEH
jgi:hypothetical protein